MMTLTMLINPLWMKRNEKLISLIVVFFLSVFGVAATAEPSLAPEKLVMDVSTQVLDEIKKDPALAAADPAHVNQLVDKRFCPIQTSPR